MFFVMKRTSTFSFRRHVLESFQKHCTILLSDIQISPFLVICIHVVIVVSSKTLTQRYVEASQ